MGGGSGGIIIRKVVHQGLTDPTVHGQLPATMLGNLDPVLAVDPSTWTTLDCEIVAWAAHWALCNLQ